MMKNKDHLHPLDKQQSTEVSISCECRRDVSVDGKGASGRREVLGTGEVNGERM